MLCSFVWCWHCGIFSLREIASASLLARQITFFFSLILTPDFYLWFNRKFKEIRKVPKNRTAQKKTPAKFILMRIICTARYTCDGPEFSKDNCMRLHLFGGFFSHYFFSHLFFFEFLVALFFRCHCSVSKKQLRQMLYDLYSRNRAGGLLWESHLVM